MNIRIASCVVLLLSVTVTIGQVASQDRTNKSEKNAAKPKEKKPKAETPPAGQPDMAEMMRKWMEMSAPGEKHAFLEQFVGEWDTVARVWMAGPDSEPQESKGTVTCRMVLGGRFVMDELKGEMFGMPYEGIGLTGYDNFKKQFVGTWTDNMNTAVLTMQGHLDQSGKTLTMYGQMDEPTTGEQDKPVKYVTRVIDENQHVFQIYDLAAGDDYKAFEVTYTRKKE